MVLLNSHESIQAIENPTLNQSIETAGPRIPPENETNDRARKAPTAKTTLNRRSRACDNCSALKVGCDKEFPSCQRCSKMGIECSWEKAHAQNYRIGRPPKKICLQSSRKNPKKVSLPGDLELGNAQFSKTVQFNLDLPQNIPFFAARAKDRAKPRQAPRKASGSGSEPSHRRKPRPPASTSLLAFLPTYINLALSSNLIGQTKFYLRLKNDCIYIGNSPVSYHLSWYPQSLRALASLASPDNLVSSGLLPKPIHSPSESSSREKNPKPPFGTGPHDSSTLELNWTSLSQEPRFIWKLVDLYFYHFNIGYSLLSREFFNQSLHSRFHAPEVKLLLNAVLMSACGFLSDSTTALELSQIYTSRVLRDLTRLCRRPCLEVVQALILLSRFPATIQTDQISHRSWYFHSLAVAMAKLLGLNLFHKYLPSDLTEARKKTWWILYTNDVLFRLHMNKHPQLFWSDASIALPAFHSHLYSSNYQTGILSDKVSRSFHPTPGLSHLSVLIRIRYFLIADIAVELHNHYRTLLCPPACQAQIQTPKFPFSWNLREQILAGPECTKFLLETKDLEARLFNWFRWSFGNLLSTCFSTYTFEVPNPQDYFSLLAMLHFVYLLVELYRPFSSNSFEMFEQLPDIPCYTLPELKQLSESEKCWFGCRLGAASILGRRSEFLEVGISGKWVMIQSFFLGLFNGGFRDQELALGLMDLTEQGALRFALAADVFALMQKLVAAKLSGIIID